MTKEIINAIGKRQVLRNHPIVAPNISCVLNWEADILSASGGAVWEFEVKISRQDFLKDKQKKKWKQLEWIGPEKKPNYFSYACPDGLIKIEEIPDFAGLYYYKDGEIREIKPPVRIHEGKVDMKMIAEKVARVYSQRNFLGCTLLTHENAEIKKRNDARDAERKKSQDRFMEFCNQKKEPKMTYIP